MNLKFLYPIIQKYNTLITEKNLITAIQKYKGVYSDIINFIIDKRFKTSNLFVLDRNDMLNIIYEEKKPIKQINKEQLNKKLILQDFIK